MSTLRASASGSRGRDGFDTCTNIILSVLAVRGGSGVLGSSIKAQRQFDLTHGALRVRLGLVEWDMQGNMHFFVSFDMTLLSRHHLIWDGDWVYLSHFLFNSWHRLFLFGFGLAPRNLWRYCQHTVLKI
jgi:hypothetical protein